MGGLEKSDNGRSGIFEILNFEEHMAKFGISEVYRDFGQQILYDPPLYNGYCLLQFDWTYLLLKVLLPNIEGAFDPHFGSNYEFGMSDIGLDKNEISISLLISKNLNDNLI